MDRPHSRETEAAPLTHRVDMESGKYYSIYEELPQPPAGTISTRVLALLPGAPGDLIQCQLRTVIIGTVDNATRYEALSYCWGEENETETIQCNGRAILVRRNLEAALRQLRLPDRPRILWADAICINQENIPERNSQVSIMSLIYRHAESVVVWLGEASDTTEQAMWFLYKLSDANEKFGDIVRTGFMPHTTWPWPEIGKFLGIRLDPLRRRKPGPIMALEDFMRRSWFNRLWIIQEVTSATDIHIRCGHFSIPWRKLYDGLRFSAKCSITENKLDSSPWAPFTLRLEEKSTVGLLYLLQYYQYADCMDPRDKIYAHFGLSRLTHLESLRSLREEYASIGISPDYEIPVQELYKRFAYAMIKLKENLDILSVLGLCRTETPSLPSWVPDWQPSIAIAPLLEYTRTGPKPFCASGGTKTLPELIQNTLVLRGFVYDTVLHVSDEYKYLIQSDQSSISLMSLRSAIEPFISWAMSFSALWAQYDLMALNHSPGTWEQQLDTYWQTLVCTSKSGIKDDPEFVLQGMDEHEFVKIFKMWFYGRVFTRLSFRYGLSSPSLLIFPICILLDMILLALISWGTPSVYTSIFSLLRIAGRRVVRTRKGHLGLVVPGARVGDSIGIFQGGKTPLIMRATGVGTWKILGDGYIHGIMNGEVWDETKCEEIRFD